jgi:hypothetical protein
MTRHNDVSSRCCLSRIVYRAVFDSLPLAPGTAASAVTGGMPCTKMCQPVSNEQVSQTQSEDFKSIQELSYWKGTLYEYVVEYITRTSLIWRHLVMAVQELLTEKAPCMLE